MDIYNIKPPHTPCLKHIYKFTRVPFTICKDDLNSKLTMYKGDFPTVCIVKYK